MTKILLTNNQTNELQEPTDNIQRAIQKQFDSTWYERTYKQALQANRKSDESAYEFYTRVGAKFGHDPHPNFSEILYRHKNPDVLKHISDNPGEFGFKHYVEHGFSEKDRIKYDSHDANRTREIVLAIDREFLARNYASHANAYADIIDYYFARVREDSISPTEEFSEAGYRELNADIVAGISTGALLCGFDHFLKVRGEEMRGIISHSDHLEKMNQTKKEASKKETQLALEASVPGITYLAAIDVLNAFDFFEGAVDTKVTPPEPIGGLLVFVPHFLPEILFGGYMAFYSFLAELKKRTGIKLHMIVTNMGTREVYASNLLRMKLKSPDIYSLFDDYQRFDSQKREVSVPSNFQIISYCAEMHPIAANVAKRLKRKPIFFIQEFEPDFHANTDMRTFTENTFLIPHHAIYNSEKLVEFFEKKTNVFKKSGGDYNYASIENPILPLKLTRTEYLNTQHSKHGKRLIIYGRPEGHAARNHFATLVHALRKATRTGVFPQGDWEFSAIGSLAFDQSIDLNGSAKLRMLPKMPKDQYEDYLLSGDIGISVITTPHPGIVHFQMAAFGLTTITNRTEFRDSDWLQQQNRNLVPVDMNIDSIVEGLKIAVSRCDDFQDRYNNAISANIPAEMDCTKAALQMMASLVSS